MVAPPFQQQRNQSDAVARWAEAFEGQFYGFLYDDLVSDPVGLFKSITRTIGRMAVPEDASILSERSDPGLKNIEGLDALRAELEESAGGETKLLCEALGGAPRWAAQMTVASRSARTFRALR
jgi:hypothetical protein